MKWLENKKTQRACAVVLVAFLFSVFFVTDNVVSSGWSLLPPLLAISVSFLSGQLSLSLGSAVLVGSFLYSYGQEQNFITSVVGMSQQTAQYFWSAGSDSTNLQILGFVFFILSMVHVMTASGGLHALVRHLQKFIVGPRSAQFVTALLGCFIFIDDYANTMIVGSTMKKVTDRYGISREKLAFLVDATSAPIAGVALVSTWIGYEVGLFGEMAQQFQWGIDGYAVFLDAIPYRFYCFLMLFFVFVNVISGVDFGPMKRSFQDVKEDPVDDKEGPQGHVICAVFPLFFLLTLVFTLLWADGGGFDTGKSVFSLTDWRTVLTASENGIRILFTSSLLSYGSAFVLGLMFSDQSFHDLRKTFWAGIKSSGLPIMILILAWSLKEVCDDLKTGEFIVSTLSDRVSASWLPLAIFIVSAITAFSTGTSWGTMAILIPTVTPLAVSLAGGEYSLFVSLCLAAILDGAIMGDHCSPISDTTIMSCISTDCDLLNHVKTQLPYSLFVGVLAMSLGYLPVSWGYSMSISVPVALLIILALFFVLRQISFRRSYE